MLSYFLQAQIFLSFEELNSSDSQPEIGTIGFTVDTQNIYIYTSMGWKRVQVHLLAMLSCLVVYQ